jgi:hypothetical protein
MRGPVHWSNPPYPALPSIDRRRQHHIFFISPNLDHHRATLPDSFLVKAKASIYCLRSFSDSLAQPESLTRTIPVDRWPLCPSCIPPSPAPSLTPTSNEYTDRMTKHDFNRGRPSHHAPPYYVFNPSRTPPPTGPQSQHPTAHHPPLDKAQSSLCNTRLF